MSVYRRLSAVASRFGVLLVVLTAGLWAGPAMAEDVVFADGDFSGWTFDNLAEPGQSSEGSRMATGGNPGAALEAINHTSNGETWLFALDDDGQWDATADGAIETVTFSVEVRGVQGFGQGMGIHVVAHQDGKYYAAPASAMTTGYSGVWEPVSFPPYEASDFAFVTECTTENWDITDNPDFSASGSPVDFGFMVGNQSSYSYDFIHHYDNYQLTVTPVPEPGTMVLLALGGLAGLARRRTPA